VQDRQVAIARLLAVGLTGNLLGATISGVLGDLFGWRGVFLIIGAAGVIVAAIAFFAFRNIQRPKPKAFNLTAVAAGFRSVFADPRAKFCFGSVFFEGIFIHGMFPYVALLLLATGVTKSSFAGLVIAGFGAGGIIYSFVVAYLVERFNQRKLMLAGGTLAAIALALVALNFPWYELMAVFLLLGLGFYSLHGSIQLHVTELSPTARGAAMSMHSCTFFLGQAIGPIYYGYAFSHLGTSIPPLIGAGVILIIGMVCSRFLRHRRHSVTLADGP
jgi:predicted MFS family arabinose efflux permease